MERVHVVIGSGASPADLMVVGEGPGATEDKEGSPFVGRSGQLLRRFIRSELESHGITVYITNLVACRPPKNRAPRSVEVDKCSPRLRALFEEVRPRLILAVGREALFHLSLLNPLEPNRGRIHHGIDGLPAPLLATWHPSYLLRTSSVERVAEVRQDLVLARQFLRG